MLRKVMKEYALTKDDALILSGIFGVSQLAMSMRLKQI